MAYGITQADVWQACDALLLEGQRPTIERVRQRIGRGSPNTVSPHLDEWFKHLGSRIKDPGAFAAPPALPDPIQQAAKHFWEAALAETRRDFDARLRDAMAAAVANVESEKERAGLADAAAFEAIGKATRLQSELAERSALLDRERLANAALAAHQAQAERQIEELRNRLAAADTAMNELRNTSRQDVALAIERSAAAERRAALEIDAERTARAKSDKRAEALERKLEEVRTQARAEQARHAEAMGRLQAERAASLQELQRAQAREAQLAARNAELAEAQADVRRELHAAKSQAELAERVVSALKGPGRTTAAKRRSRAKLAPPK